MVALQNCVVQDQHTITQLMNTIHVKNIMLKSKDDLISAKDYLEDSFRILVKSLQDVIVKKNTKITFLEETVEDQSREIESLKKKLEELLHK